MTAVSAVLAAALVTATAPWQALAVRRETGAPANTPAGVLRYAATAGLVTLALALRLPATALLPALPLTVVGLPLAVIDARCHRLPERLTGGALFGVVATVAAVAVISDVPDRLATALAGGLGMSGFYMLFLVLSAVLGADAAYGLGDVKLALPLGAALGWLGLCPLLAALLGAHVLYLAIHVTRAAAGHTGWRTRHAFGPPMLGAALLATLLVGAA